MALNKFYTFIFVMNIFVTKIYMLPKRNHEGCLENEEKIIHFIVGKSLKTCIQECVTRTTCLSLNYRRQHKLCELLAVADGKFVTNNGRTGPCVHILRSDITESERTNSEQTCSQENGVCVVKECPNLEFPHGVFTGNMREIGSRVLVKCVSALYLEETGRTSIQCQTDGTWDYEPNCTSSYMGCYQDDDSRNLMPFKQMNDHQMTIEKCMNHCFGYAFAAAQYGHQCFCGNTLDKTRQRSEGACNKACPGDTSQMCGGTWHGSVYKVA